MKKGLITKATGGFYYVLTEGGEVSCRARGLFRFERDKITPFVGDHVIISVEDDGSGTVAEILPRKNWLIRPPLANLDYLAAVVSLSDPEPNLVILDKFLAILEKSGIPPIVIITKPDLRDSEALSTLYRKAGFSVFVVHSPTGEGISELAPSLSGKVGAFFGNSGVGKSSLLNAIDPRFGAAVGDTSKKLGRGKHTTRHVELFPLEKGGWIADTPGFSSIDLQAFGGIGKEELAGCFIEFASLIGGCRFNNCSHIREKGCAVISALESGEISQSRYQSYQSLYNEVKDVKEWERK